MKTAIIKLLLQLLADEKTRKKVLLLIGSIVIGFLGFLMMPVVVLSALGQMGTPEFAVNMEELPVDTAEVAALEYAEQSIAEVMNDLGLRQQTLKAQWISNRENYVEYFANRPGAVKFGAHGLFSQEDVPIDLDAVMQEVAKHPGNVWTHVVSLRRDDAQRVGYDNLSAWRELVKRQIPNIARQMKIDLSHLKWYAAFHDKETNPHVHIVVYSTDPHECFLTNHGIEKIRSGFANDIYSDELHGL